MTPPTGGEPSLAAGVRLVVTCPKCGHLHELPPIAPPAARLAAQDARPSARLNRAVELEDATPTMPQPIDGRLAPTERLTPPER